MVKVFRAFARTDGAVRQNGYRLGVQRNPHESFETDYERGRERTTAVVDGGVAVDDL